MNEHERAPGARFVPRDVDEEERLERGLAYEERRRAAALEAVERLRVLLPAIDPEALYDGSGVHGPTPNEGLPPTVPVVGTTAKQVKVAYRGAVRTLSREVLATVGRARAGKFGLVLTGAECARQMQAAIEGQLDTIAWAEASILHLRGDIGRARAAGDVEPRVEVAMDRLLRDHGQLVRELSRAIRDEGYGLSAVRSRVCHIVRDRAWERFIVPETGQAMEYGPDGFLRFVTTPPLEGLGTDIDTLRGLCEDDTEALAALDTALEVARPHGGDRRSERFKNVNQQLETGRSGSSRTSRMQGLRRLRRADQPGYGEVLAGEKSVHGALVDAGIRRKRVSVYVDDPKDAARTLLRYYGVEGLDAIAEAGRRIAGQGA